MKKRNLGKLLMGAVILSGVLFSSNVLRINATSSSGYNKKIVEKYGNEADTIEKDIEYNLNSNFPPVPVIVKE